MIRVYFDWNIFANLKRESEEPFKSILRIIKNHKGKLVFPYSPAHLRDLKRGFEKNDEAKAKTYADLELLHKISEDHCLCIRGKDHEVTPEIINPTEYFNWLIEDKLLEDFNVDDVFSDSDEAISNIWKGFLDLMKLIPLEIDLQQIEKISTSKDDYKDIFFNLRHEDNLYNFIKDIIPIISNPEKYSSLYTSTRNTSVAEMKINTSSEQWGNPFDYLDKILLKNQFGKTFEQVIKDGFNNRNKPVTQFEYFTNYYTSLDSFGYYRDKQLANLIDDATHAYYGAHCDIFVTEDNNTYQKAKAIYDNFNISTTVCKASDFLSAFYSRNGFKNTSPTIIMERIIDALGESLIISQTVDEDFNSVIIFEIRHPIVDFFNRMQVSYLPDCTMIFIYRKIDNYSSFMFWTEIAAVVNKVVRNFGIDNNLRTEFDSIKEQEEIINRTWKGRVWKHNRTTINLCHDSSQLGLALIITINNCSV